MRTIKNNIKKKKKRIENRVSLYPFLFSSILLLSVIYIHIYIYYILVSVLGLFCTLEKGFLSFFSSMHHDPVEPAWNRTHSSPSPSRSSPLVEPTPAMEATHAEAASTVREHQEEVVPQTSERNLLLSHWHRLSPDGASLPSTTTAQHACAPREKATKEHPLLPYLQHSSVSSMESIFLCSGPRLRVVQPRIALEKLEETLPSHHKDSPVEQLVREAWKDVHVPSPWYWQVKEETEEEPPLWEDSQASRKREREGVAAPFVLPFSSSFDFSPLSNVHDEHQGRSMLPSFASQTPSAATSGTTAPSAMPCSQGLSTTTPFAASSLVFSSGSCSDVDTKGTTLPFVFPGKIPRKKTVLPRIPHPLDPLGSFYPTREAAMMGSGYCSHQDLVVVGLDKPMTIITLRPSSLTSSSRIEEGGGDLHQRRREPYVYACIPGAGQKVFSVLPTTTTITDLSLHPWSSAVSSTSEMVESVLQESPGVSSCTLPPVYTGSTLSPLAAFVEAMPHPHSRNLYVLIDEVAPVDPFVDIDLGLPPPRYACLLHGRKEKTYWKINATTGNTAPVDGEGNQDGDAEIHGAVSAPLDGYDSTVHPFSYYLERASYSVRLAAEFVLQDIIEFLMENFETLLGTPVKYLVALTSSYCVMQHESTPAPLEKVERKEHNASEDHQPWAREARQEGGADPIAGHPEEKREMEMIEGKMSFHVHFRLDRQEVMQSIRELDLLMRQVREAAKREAGEEEKGIKKEVKGDESLAATTVVSSENEEGWTTATPHQTRSHEWWALYHRRLRARMVLDCIDFSVYNRWRPFRLPYNVKAPTVPTALDAAIVAASSGSMTKRRVACGKPSSLPCMEEEREWEEEAKRKQELLQSGILLSNEIKGMYTFLELVSPEKQEDILRVVCGMQKVETDSNRFTIPPYQVGSVAPQVLTEVRLPFPTPLSSSSFSGEGMPETSCVPGESSFSSVTEIPQGAAGRDTAAQLCALMHHVLARRSRPQARAGEDVKEERNVGRRNATEVAVMTTLPFPFSSLDWKAISHLVIQLLGFRFRCLLPMVPPYTHCAHPALGRLLTSYSPFRYSEPVLRRGNWIDHTLPTSTEDPPLDRIGKRQASHADEASRFPVPCDPSSENNSEEVQKVETPAKKERQGSSFSSLHASIDAVVAAEQEEKKREQAMDGMEGPSFPPPSWERRPCSSTPPYQAKLTAFSTNILFQLAVIQRSFMAPSATPSDRLRTAPSSWHTCGALSSSPRPLKVGGETRVGRPSGRQDGTEVMAGGALGYSSTLFSSALGAASRVLEDFHVPRPTLSSSSYRVPVTDLEVKRIIAQIFYALHPAFTGVYEGSMTGFDPSTQPPVFQLPGDTSFFSPSYSKLDGTLTEDSKDRRGNGNQKGPEGWNEGTQCHGPLSSHSPPASLRRLDCSSLACYERQSGYRAVVPELLRVQYQEDGVRSYFVFQKQSKFCLKLQRCHRATHAQLFLTYNCIKVRCYSNDCYESFLWIPWARPPPPSSSSLFSSNTTSTDASPGRRKTQEEGHGEGVRRMVAPYPQYERLTSIRQLLFPERS